MYYTERLMLRSLDPEADKSALLQLFNEEDFMIQFQFDVPKPTSRETVLKWIRKRLEQHAESGLPIFAVCEKPTPDNTLDNLEPHQDLFIQESSNQARHPLIGMLGFSAFPKYSLANRVASVGLAFDRTHRGQGLGTEVLRWGLEFGFGTMGLHKIELQTGGTNAVALKCYDKMGFVREGVKRSCVFRKGRWEDIVCMGMLEEEWLEKKDLGS